jgi:TonB family protein
VVFQVHALATGARRRIEPSDQQMRFVLCLLAIAWMGTDAWADEAEKLAFQREIATYLREHPPQYPAKLMDLHSDAIVRVIFSIDRDGKLLDTNMSSGSGSPEADRDIVDWLKRLQPFPKIPTDLPAPFKVSEELVFSPTTLIGDVKIRWVTNAAAPAKEVAFRDQVASHLHHHPLAYAEEMKALHGKRHVGVALLIDRSGNLLKLDLIEPFGSKVVDESTLAWLEAAQPYPQIPAGLEAPLKLTAELEFGPPRKRDEPWNDDKVKRVMSNVCKGC